MQTYLECITNETVSLVISRQLISEINQLVVQLPAELSKEICKFALEKIRPRVVSFEEQVAVIRQHLALLYERESNGIWQQMLWYSFIFIF